MVETVHWRLELRIAGDSIDGSACDDSGRCTSFEGWLGLIALVERAQTQLGAGPATTGLPAPGGGRDPDPELDPDPPARPPDTHPPQRGAS